MRYNPTVLGIVGDSASGKTVLARGVALLLGAHRVTTVCAEDYLKDSREELSRKGGTAFHPDNLYLDIMAQHLGLLKRGEPVLKPRYDGKTDTFGAPVYIEPRPFILVEGAVGYIGEAIRDYYDIRLYLDPQEELRIAWKIQRDRRVAGRTEQDVVRELAQTSPDAEAFVRPQRRWADMVIGFHPAAHGRRGVAALDASLILRPSLPYMDLAPVLEAGAARGVMELALDRDMGLPVDRLDINGAAAARRLEAVQELWWDHLPAEARGHAEQTGWVPGAAGEAGRSPALALVQMLVAAYAVRVAAGHHE